MNNRKNMLIAALVTSVMFIMAGCSVPAGPVASAAQPDTTLAQTQPPAAAPGRTITVVGAGTASGTPDVAHVTIGVETQDASLSKAVAANQTRMTQLLATLKELGIADKDIRTVNYSVNTETPPVKEPATGAQPNAAAITYHVNNQVQVTVRDVTKLGDVLDKGVTAGANSIYGVDFGVADPSALEATARSNAVADAKSRAESLAKLAGVTLGDVYSISESAGGPVPVMRAASFAAASTPIQTGSYEVSASVQIVYLIK
ncbi:MAG: SIMPL domain-containing protein [Chloroflexi bacterium]|nr:SIMPL domain-containing protein [Chloroflexota bacterium]MCL5273342.1 SIMPL domain-containing protein [Chloroflexota bacterium]